MNRWHRISALANELQDWTGEVWSIEQLEALLRTLALNPDALAIVKQELKIMRQEHSEALAE
jgi:hypothetical protein